MLIDLGFMTMAFSVHLNIREWTIVLYILCLLTGAIMKVRDLFVYKSQSLLFYILEIVFLVLASLYVGRIYLAFRLSGGRK